MTTSNKIIKLIQTSKKTIVLTETGIRNESVLPEFRRKHGYGTTTKPITVQDKIHNE